MVKYGYWEGAGWVPGIAPSQLPRSRTTPGTPPPHRAVPPGMVQRCTVRYGGLNIVVGLKSVDQLSLSLLFSRFRGMTEVYNLVRIDIFNNH